jgi:hypothetical protein
MYISKLVYNGIKNRRPGDNFDSNTMSKRAREQNIIARNRHYRQLETLGARGEDTVG